MSIAEQLHVETLPDVGLVCEDDKIYGYFGTSLPRSESAIRGLWQVYRYTYGVISSKQEVVGYRKNGQPIKAKTRGWYMTRTADVTGELIPAHEGALDVHLLQNIIVVPTPKADMFVEAVSKYPLDRGVDTKGLLDAFPPSKLPAERLYRAVRSRVIEGVGYTACGTYHEVDCQLQLVVADESGGYSFGVSGVDDLVNDQQLDRMSQAPSLLATK